jgi:hypothetical protein
MAFDGASRRGPGRGPLPVELPVPRVLLWHSRGASLLVRRVARERASHNLLVRGSTVERDKRSAGIAAPVGAEGIHCRVRPQ